MTTYDCPCCDDFSGDSIQRVWTHVNHKDEEEHREYADSANFDEFKDDVGYEEDDTPDDAGDADDDGGGGDGDDDTDPIDYDNRLDGGDDGGDSDDGASMPGLPIDPLTLAVVLAVVVVAYYLVKRRSGSADDEGGEPAPDHDESEEFDPDAFLAEEGEPVDDADEDEETAPGTVSRATGGGLS